MRLYDRENAFDTVEMTEVRSTLPPQSAQTVFSASGSGAVDCLRPCRAPLAHSEILLFPNSCCACIGRTRPSRRASPSGRVLRQRGWNPSVQRASYIRAPRGVEVPLFYALFAGHEDGNPQCFRQRPLFSGRASHRRLPRRRYPSALPRQMASGRWGKAQS